MATARFVLAICLVALGCALLIAACDTPVQTLVLVGHSRTPASASAISRSSIERTAAAAQDSISSSSMALSFD